MISQITEFSFLICGQTLQYCIIPLILLGLKLTYIVCYSWWCLVYLVMTIIMNSEKDQKIKQSWQDRIAKLPFPHPDVYRDSIDIIASQGYHFQTHHIRTKDNYLLTAWRLHKDPNNLKQKYPIILQHGLLDCSWSWFLNNNSVQTLPYILCEQGYDVWVTNNRGNQYSNGHTEFTDRANNQKYWDFSFDEMVQYDVEANVKYVIETSGKEKVIYLGHSQGTTQVFGKVCVNPQFQQNLQCFIAFGPSLFVTNLRSKFVKWIIASRVIDMLYSINHPTFFYFSRDTHKYIGSLCYMFKSVYQWMLFSITNALCGYPDQNKIDISRFGVMVAHEPGGASVKTILQWMQFIKNKQFRKFDYGKIGNLRHYGQADPPQYDLQQLKKFSIPKYFFVGTKDILCGDEDVDKLVNILDKNLHVEHIKDYAHLDYVWAVDAYLKLYPKVLEIIKKNSN